MSTVTKDLYDIGEAPPIGHVPPKMHAMTVRRETFGEPKVAFRAGGTPPRRIASAGGSC